MEAMPHLVAINPEKLSDPAAIQEIINGITGAGDAFALSDDSDDETDDEPVHMHAKKSDEVDSNTSESISASEDSDDSSEESPESYTHGDKVKKKEFVDDSDEDY
jgi:hypothetical protein